MSMAYPQPQVFVPTQPDEHSPGPAIVGMAVAVFGSIVLVALLVGVVMLASWWLAS
jgi:hypothetical protein